MTEHYGFTLGGNPHDAAGLPADVVARYAPDLLTHAPLAALQVHGWLVSRLADRLTDSLIDQNALTHSLTDLTD